MKYANYTNEQMAAQYAKVDALHAAIDAINGEDPYREMSESEVAKLVELTAACDEAIAEMKYMERAIYHNAPHAEGQADF